MSWFDCTLGDTIPLDVHGPLTCLIIVLCALNPGTYPHVELHEARVGFKPVANLILWCEVWPVARKRHICHVSVLNGVMGHESLIMNEPCLVFLAYLRMLTR